MINNKVEKRNKIIRYLKNTGSGLVMACISLNFALQKESTPHLNRTAGELYHILWLCIVKKGRPSQNFSFWESCPEFIGKNGRQAAFSGLSPKPTGFWGKIRG
jgi:hypothetical protein